MVYLDYAANYPAKKEVLDVLVYAETNFIGNFNSTHIEGVKTKAKYDEYNNKIKKLLNIGDDYELIYTSSATESNNMAIKGVIESYKGFGKRILVSEFEHNSVNATLGFLKTSGFDVDFFDCNHLADLEKKMNNDVILVVSTLVDSETGMIFDTKKIKDIINKYPNAHHLVDATQAIGKFDVNFSDYELISFTPHKFGGITGSGVLVKRKSTILTPIIHGGLSQSIYRSGSVPIGIIASIYKSIDIALANKNENYIKVKELNGYLLDKLKEIKGVFINSFDNPYIINISIDGIKSKDIIEYFNNHDICVSQKSACSIKNTPSKSIMKLFNDKKRALGSFRISISDLTSKDDINIFIKSLKEYVNGKI